MVSTMKTMTLAFLALGAVLGGCTTDADAQKDTGNSQPSFVFDDSTDAEQDPGRSLNGFSNVPEDFVHMTGRDGIMAIWDPIFVTADKANMPDDAEVIGVAINGEARAYSINLLDGIEIVNDTVGGKKIAVTW